jgi:hypothetical protein
MAATLPAVAHLGVLHRDQPLARHPSAQDGRALAIPFLDVLLPYAPRGFGALDALRGLGKTAVLQVSLDGFERPEHPKTLGVSYLAKI